MLEPVFSFSFSKISNIILWKRNCFILIFNCLNLHLWNSPVLMSQVNLVSPSGSFSLQSKSSLALFSLVIKAFYFVVVAWTGKMAAYIGLVVTLGRKKRTKKCLVKVREAYSFWPLYCLELLFFGLFILNNLLWTLVSINIFLEP